MPSRSTSIAETNLSETKRRIYLDHAATSWPKADGVTDAMVEFFSSVGASASRGNYASAMKASELVRSLRHKLARFIHAESESCISFHGGCTHALNCVIHGLVGSSKSIGDGSHLLLSAVEHNAVIRPLLVAAKSCNATVEEVPTDRNGLLDADEVISRINNETRLVALSHVSNVTGAVQPIAEIGAAVAEANRSRADFKQILFLCDAAQSFGYLPINVASLGVHALAAPAHKGCGGPPGIGMLYVSPKWHSAIQPWMQGGTGDDGRSDEMPESMPAKLEPGTMNLPAIAGWLAAMESMATPNELDDSSQKLAALSQRLHVGLNGIDGIKVFGQPGPLPIASLDFGPALPPDDAAAILDSEFGIEVRSGHHCAARLHSHLGTETAGTLRISGGHGTTSDEIDVVVAAVAEIAAQITSLV
ncbi:aminotransferase class V-fold PLP-dependent enzyme [Rhodopirellula europaea]|uniref:cysteine desulfurase n=1 Tax=Rhodopirellula europaea 6C TaxID=1263867 RepID=M2ABZ6_9BACT|nr:aminotransferase class V-fold PLP-dependent enzyme [Rhodopirellula europaea]EMB14325.1 Aminotransferase, class V/Cysteine desulfurase [Rhodopirellula europaea 6C]